MRRRLLTSVLSSVVVLALLPGSAPADTVSPVRGLELRSPVHFVLPTKPVRIPLGRRAVLLARTQLGVRYVYGGSSPSGFDCSGLVSWVYGRLGIALPHNAAALYGVGRDVPLRAMRPGDLVFFHGLGHVGIYIGHGRMIHAPQTGRNVEIEALGARSSLPVGARRVTAH
jgi:NlpC/P60 family